MYGSRHEITLPLIGEGEMSFNNPTLHRTFKTIQTPYPEAVWLKVAGLKILAFCPQSGTQNTLP